MIGVFLGQDRFFERLRGEIVKIDGFARCFVVVKFGAEVVFDAVAIDVVREVKFNDVDVFVDFLGGRVDFRQLALRALYGGISATLVAKLTRLCEPRTEVAFLTDSLKAFLSSRASARRKTVSAGFAALIVGLEMVGMLMGMLMPIVRTSRTSVCRY